jgi:hypothetical protein
MGAIRIRLLKSYKHIYKEKAWPRGTVIQVDTVLASELIRTKTGEKYEGEYPPKNKMKTEFFKPK